MARRLSGSNFTGSSDKMVGEVKWHVWVPKSGGFCFQIIFFSYEVFLSLCPICLSTILVVIRLLGLAALWNNNQIWSNSWVVMISLKRIPGENFVENQFHRLNSVCGTHPEEYFRQWLTKEICHIWLQLYEDGGFKLCESWGYGFGGNYYYVNCSFIFIAYANVQTVTNIFRVKNWSRLFYLLPFSKSVVKSVNFQSYLMFQRLLPSES